MLSRTLKFGISTASLLLGAAIFPKQREGVRQTELVSKTTIVNTLRPKIILTVTDHKRSADPPSASRPNLDHEQLEDCQAIYIQHAIDPILQQLELWGEANFSKALEFGCHFSLTDQLSRPPYPYDNCYGDIQIGDQFNGNTLVIKEDTFSSLPRVSFDQSFSSEEIVKLKQCIVIYRSRAQKDLAELSIPVDQSALFQMGNYLSKGCQMEYDPNSNSFHVRPPEFYVDCSANLPNLETELSYGAKRQLIQAVYESASDAYQKGEHARAFRLLDPAYLRMEMELFLDEEGGDPDFKDYYNDLLSFIEGESGKPSGVCSSLYRVRDFPFKSESKTKDKLKLLPLVYMVVANGMSACDFDDQ